MTKESADEKAARLNELRKALDGDEGLRKRFDSDADSVLTEKGFSPKLRESFRAFATDTGCSCSCLPIFDGAGVGCFGAYDGAKGYTA